MLSYVIPTQDTSPSGENSAQATSPQRNLSLNLNQVTAPLKSNNAYEQAKLKAKKVDIMLANVSGDSSCDERTRLLSRQTPPPLNPRRQNSENNNSFISNNNSCVGGGGGDYVEEDTLSEETEIPVIVDSDASDKQFPRQTTKKPKLSKLGSKSVGLKRVSFGSSKGSMVETLVFETPTPLSEHVEPVFGFESDNSYKAQTNYNTYSKANMEDSGIELQEESERSIVRVSIYQSNQPQQICPPEYFTKFEDNLDNSFSNYNYNLEDIMTAASTIPGYDRQQSTDSGWDNPFRPGGDLSREADEIVSLIRGGKPITPTEDHSIENGKAQKEDNCNGTAAVENIAKKTIAQTQSAQNGTPSSRVQSTAKPPENNGVTSLAQVSKQVVPGPTSASHVVIDEKKNKKKGCCIIQ